MSTNLDGTPRNGGLIRADAITGAERPWMELVEHHGVLAARDELLELGLTSAIAAGIAVWLDDQLKRRRVSSHVTAHRYRRTLEQVGPPPEDSPRIRAIPGYINGLRRDQQFPLFQIRELATAS